MSGAAGSGGPAREDGGGIERLLEGVRFRPRESLGAEIVGRLRRGEQSKGAARSRRRRFAPLVAAAAVITTAVVWVDMRPRDVAADQCCVGLAGGLDADDGVVVIARGGERVRRIAVYEDRDGSRSYTAGDVVRFTRGAQPTLGALAGAELVTTRHCCVDFDGGGPEDDGLLVVGRPPDQVIMVALYEEPRGAKPSRYILR